jgi:hypothetical protein
MLITIAAALAAAQAAPATAPAQPMPMAEHSADKMKDCCCCKDMKSKMDSDHANHGKDEHQGHAAH